MNVGGSKLLWLRVIVVLVALGAVYLLYNPVDIVFTVALVAIMVGSVPLAAGIHRFISRRAVRPFPDLAGLSDADIQAKVQALDRAHAWRRTSSFVLGGAAVLGLGVGGMMLGVLADDSLRRATGWAPVRYDDSLLNYTPMACQVLGAVVGVALVLWHEVSWRRSALRREYVAKNNTCPRCRYDLSGLEPDGALLTCPECGMASRAGVWSGEFDRLVHARNAMKGRAAASVGQKRGDQEEGTKA